MRAVDFFLWRPLGVSAFSTAATAALPAFFVCIASLALRIGTK
jgi:hypothetical protein